jgi:hypothetical protein
MKALRHGLPLGTAALLILGSTATTLACQQTTERPPDAVMLKRIAEAVDGDRSGGMVYVVAGYDPANPIVGVFHDPKSATGAASKVGNGAAVFGPYQAALDSTIAQTMTCVHIKTSVMSVRCVPPGRTTQFSDIASLTLMITRTDGGRDSVPLPQGADAIFLGAPAVDKFVIPYYVRLVGLTATTDMRNGFGRP